MSVSAHARLLYIGLLNEAFDDGVFEWKTLTLKARIFPVDTVDVDALLAELCDANMIKRAAGHPKEPGLIRNFRKFQRPKSPNDSGILPNCERDYVGLSGTISETLPKRSGSDGEKSPQMEDGGGNREEINTPLPPSGESEPQIAGKPDPVADEFDEFWTAYPGRDGANPRKPALSRYRSARKTGATAAELLAGAKALAAKHAGDKGADRRFVPRTTTWLSEERWKADKPPPCARSASGIEGNDISSWLRGAEWPSILGPPPHQPGFRGDLAVAERVLSNKFAQGRRDDRCKLLRDRLGEVSAAADGEGGNA